jgi:hypothetical protein
MCFPEGGLLGLEAWGVAGCQLLLLPLPFAVLLLLCLGCGWVV